MGDFGLCNRNSYEIKCNGFRLDTDNKYHKASSLQYKYVDIKMLISLYTTNPDNEDERKKNLKLLNDLQILEKAKKNKVMDMKGFYSTIYNNRAILPSDDANIARLKQIMFTKKLGAQLNKKVLSILKDMGIEIIVLHAAGSGDLIKTYKRNGMVHFANSSYKLTDDCTQLTLSDADYMYIEYHNPPNNLYDLEQMIKKMLEIDATIILCDDKVVTPQNLFVGQIDNMIKAVETVPDMRVTIISSDILDEYDKIIGGRGKKKSKKKKSKKKKSKKKKSKKKKSKKKKSKK